MPLRHQLEGLDQARLEAAFDGAFDKAADFAESGVMVDRLADDFPALASLLDRLRVRVAEELSDEKDRRNAVFGATLIVLGLVEYAAAEALRAQFPDVPEAPVS